MPDDKLSFEQFGARIKAKHPEYADMPDGDVGRRVYAKFPQYQDMVDPNMKVQQQAPAPTATLSAVRQPTSVGEASEKAFGDFINDVRYGTDSTLAGKMLHKAGMPALYSGTSQSTANLMGSPVTGMSRAAQGMAQVHQGKVKQGAGNVVGGLSEAATIPSMVVAPEASTTVASKAAGLLPDAERAGKVIGEVESVAGDVPVALDSLNQVAERTRQLAKSGGRMPKVVGDWIKRVTNPDLPAPTLAEARDFYKNATRISGQESYNLTPVMQRQVAMFTDTLGKAITDAAATRGMADKYIQGMGEYASAAQNARRVEALKQLLIDSAKHSIPYAAGAYGISKAIGGR